MEITGSNTLIITINLFIYYGPFGSALTCVKASFGVGPISGILFGVCVCVCVCV